MIPSKWAACSRAGGWPCVTRRRSAGRLGPGAGDVLARVLVECFLAAGRAEVIRLALLERPVFSLVGFDAHAADRIDRRLMWFHLSSWPRSPDGQTTHSM